MKNVVIFAIDNGHDLHTQAKFLRHLDTARSMGSLTKPVDLAIGCYQGHVERAYIMDTEDYARLVRPLTYTRGQESVLVVDSDGVASLSTPDLTAPLGVIGSLYRITTPFGHDPIDSWTFVEREGVYYAA